MAMRTGRADIITKLYFDKQKKPGSMPGFLLMPRHQKDMDTVAPYSRERPTTEKS
jgi:hypothetical protein